MQTCLDLAQIQRERRSLPDYKKAVGIWWNIESKVNLTDGCEGGWGLPDMGGAPLPLPRQWGTPRTSISSNLSKAKLFHATEPGALSQTSSLLFLTHPSSCILLRESEFKCQTISWFVRPVCQWTFWMSSRSNFAIFERQPWDLGNVIELSLNQVWVLLNQVWMLLNEILFISKTWFMH